MIMQHALDKNDERNGTGEQNEPNHRPALRQKSRQHGRVYTNGLRKFKGQSAPRPVRHLRRPFSAPIFQLSPEPPSTFVGADDRTTAVLAARPSRFSPATLQRVRRALVVLAMNPAQKSRIIKAAATPRQAVPKEWGDDVERVLITPLQLSRRIRELSAEITRDFSGRETVVVSLLNGTVLFLADLIRHLSLPLRLDFIGVSSYGAGTVSGHLIFTKELRLDVRGRDVLLVDDILDTGRTMKRVRETLIPLGPRCLRTCVLLDKPARRIEAIQADYVGFTIPDLFVVGYGLDYAERYRNLPFVGVLKADRYTKDSDASE